MLIEIYFVVEGQNCTIDNDCCVEVDDVDCTLKCQKTFRTYELKLNTVKPPVNTEDKMIRKEIGKCIPKGRIN